MDGTSPENDGIDDIDNPLSGLTISGAEALIIETNSGISNAGKAPIKEAPHNAPKVGLSFTAARFEAAKFNLSKLTALFNGD